MAAGSKGLKLRVIGDGQRDIKMDELLALKQQLPPHTPAICLFHAQMQEGQQILLPCKDSGISMVDMVFLLRSLGISAVHSYACFNREGAANIADAPDLMQPGKRLNAYLPGGKADSSTSQSMHDAEHLITYYGDCLQRNEFPDDIKTLLFQLEHTQQCLSNVVVGQGTEQPGVFIHCPGFNRVDDAEGGTGPTLRRIARLQSSRHNDSHTENRIKVSLLAELCNVSPISRNRKQALLNAFAFRGKVQLVQQLLNRYPDIDPNDVSMKISALHFAALCMTRGPAVIRALSKARGIDINQKNWIGETALHTAISAGNTFAVRELLSIPAVTANSKCKRGHTPLMLAAGTMNFDVVSDLVSSRKFLDVNAQSDAGESALMLAVFNGHMDTVRQLLTLRGICPALRDPQGRTAADYARSEVVYRQVCELFSTPTRQ
ncbi:hypothetical protein ASE08_14370 [Rhizobacter sp. Root16D2]|nr:hypothetical protein ASC88_26100 [Rhizobacter sp. Root29]KQW01036.1 hypothetical protein ASC98_06865 [Rhizobacter sp. Root1238]KRB03886.1 hypothetical protein ASE08_14370 [Rhizobacter sp. Root16D2]